MSYPSGTTVIRERRAPKPDPYNPDRTVPGSWEDELSTVELEGAFVASSSSIAPADATRSQIITAKSLYCTDADADVLPGDRIRSGTHLYAVKVRPEADRNPFTGWQPVVEIPLEEAEG
jgi:hypothetical protein